MKQNRELDNNTTISVFTYTDFPKNFLTFKYVIFDTLWIIFVIDGCFLPWEDGGDRWM